MDATDRVIDEYEQSLRDLQALERNLERNASVYDDLLNQIELFEEARIFLQELAEMARAKVASGLEKVVTLCLQSVFGESMSFEIEIDTSRNNTVVDFFVLSQDGDSIVRFSPENSMGGGVVDTVAIGLRFGLLMILDPRPVGPIFLDEPAKMVSADLIELIGSLLQELNTMFNKQNIIVTHHLALMDTVDHAIQFEKRGGVTKIKAINGEVYRG
ncbi:hypothetical protein ACQKJG_18730 [Priestia megaterium]|uniref:hypothetical protein n=1 Tax=Priestia megaterium TaxID=1404 RepID=UPI003D03ADB3